MTTVEDEDATMTITSVLVDQASCSSWEEAAAIVDTIHLEIVKDDDDDDSPSFAVHRELWLTGLQEYLGVSKEVSGQILSSAFGDVNEDSSPTVLVQHGDREQILNDSDKEEEFDSDTDFIEEGECELCERSNIKLTRHHLVPRSTWPRIETRLLHAANATDPEKAILIAGENLKHLIPPQNCEEKMGLRKKKWIKGALQRTCLICRACHSAVHNTHENMVLALEYNTSDKLLQDVKIRSFCKWASKQRVGKYAV